MTDPLDIDLDPRSVIAKRALELMSEGRVGDELELPNVVGGLLFAVAALEVEVIRLQERMTDTQWVMSYENPLQTAELFASANDVREMQSSRDRIAAEAAAARHHAAD